MRKLPPSVRIGPYVYRLKRDSSVDGAHRWAETDFINHELRFGRACDEKELPISLIHELVHAAASAYAVDLEENQVQALGSGIAQALLSLGLLPEELEL